MGNENINVERKSKKGWQQSETRNNFKKPANGKKQQAQKELLKSQED